MRSGTCKLALKRTHKRVDGEGKKKTNAHFPILIVSDCVTPQRGFFFLITADATSGGKKKKHTKDAKTQDVRDRLKEKGHPQPFWTSTIVGDISLAPQLGWELYFLDFSRKKKQQKNKTHVLLNTIDVFFFSF